MAFHGAALGNVSLGTILLVEDEVLIRVDLAEYVRSAGYARHEDQTGLESQRVLLPRCLSRPSRLMHAVLWDALKMRSCRGIGGSFSLL